MTTIQTRQTPLEVLVVSQLAAIKKQELALKTRLTVPSSANAVTAFEISALQTRMDRLNRMIDAMSLTWSQPAVHSDSQAVA